MSAVPGGGGRHPASMTANIRQRRRQRIRRGTTSRRIWYGGHHGAPSAPFRPDDDNDNHIRPTAGAIRNGDQAAGIMARRLLNGMQSGRQHIRVSFSTDGDHIRPTRRRFLEVARMASGIDDRQHTPTATAAHTDNIQN